jgi:hypothetical protein
MRSKNLYSVIGHLVVAITFLTVSCSKNEFASGGSSIVNQRNPLKTSDANPIDPNPIDPGQPAITVRDNGVIALPDYKQCAKLPSTGYAGSGACSTNEVLVMINDGNDPGRSCCPIGAGALSTIASEVNQPRPGSCLENEVSTGIRDMSTPYCTKIETGFLKLSAPIAAVYGTKGSTSELAALAGGYHRKDLCACPAGSIIIGGIPSANDSCSSIKCAKIERK